MKNMKNEGLQAMKSDWRRLIILFLTSQTITLLGSSLVQYAIIWHVAKTTDSGMMVTFSTICGFVPQVFISLFAGVWADRYNRKLLIIAADGTIAVTTLVLAIFMMNGYYHIGMLFFVSAIRSLGSGVQIPSVNAVIAQIVPTDQLIRVNGINGSIMAFVNLVSPALGGAVLTYGVFYNILLIDVFTAAVGIGVLLSFHIPLHHKAAIAEKTHYLADLRDGVSYSLSHYFVKMLLCFYAVFTFLIVPPVFLNVLMVTRVFGDSYFYLTLNEVSFAVGAVLGGFLVAAWGGFTNRLHTLVLGCAVFGVFTFAIGFITTFWIYLVVMFFTGFTMPLFNAPVTSLLQEKVEQDMHGRVFSLVQITFSSIMPIGILIFGPMADKIPIQWLMIGSGFLMAVISVLMLQMKNFMTEGLPLKTSGVPSDEPSGEVSSDEEE